MLAEDFAKPVQPQKSGLIKVPQSWNGYKIDGNKLAGDGYATYRLMILLNDQPQKLALKFLDMGTAYLVFVNGERVLSVGEVGTTRELSVPQYFPLVVDLKPVSEKIELIYNVSNFHHRKGGAWEVIRLGTKEQINKQRERRLAFDLILFGCIMIIGIYHIAIYSLRKEALSSLYFGLFCILIALRLLTTVERYLTHIYTKINWELFVKIEYLSIYLAVPIFALFLHSLFRQDFHKFILKSMLLIGLFFSVLILITPVRIYSHTLIVYQLFIVSGFIYGSYVLLRATLLKREGALIIIAGYLILFITAINDILDINEIIQTGHFIQLGMLVFIFSQAFLLSYRYSKAYRTIDRQRDEVEKINIEYKKEISERGQAEENLRESEEQYRLLAENVTDLIVTLDMNLRIKYISPSVTRITGYSVDEALALTIEEILTPASFATAMKAFVEEMAMENMEHIDLQRSRTLELEGYRKDGSTIWVEATISTIRGPDNQIVEILGIVRDIAERKRTEKALRESEEKYRTLVENIPGIVFRLSALGYIQYISPNVEELYGCKPEDLIGKHLKKTTPISEVLKALETLKYAISGEIIKNFEINQRDSKGNTVPMEVHVAPLVEDGKTIGVQGVMIDSTNRRQLEDQLRQAQKMEAIGQLAGGVAHDFNNLLAAIIGFSEIGITGTQEATGVESFDHIIRKSQQGAKLVSQLLAFSSEQLLDVKLLNLNGIVDEATGFFRRVIGEDIDLITEFDPHLKAIKADSTAIHQVITNLGINARDAMPEGGTLEIRTQNIVIDDEFCETHSWAAPGTYVKLTVKDTGIGMNEETLKQIFNPFFTTKERWEGTGLGLSMVYGIVKQHNGHVDCISEIGEGTTFELYFPVIISESEIRVEKRTPEQDVHKGTETILLVEDDPDVIMVGRKMLEQSGYTVLTAEDGVEAIKIFKDNKATIDLVITDVILPRKNGLELYKSIQQINSAIKFLFISGYTGSGVHKKYNLETGLDLLQKPFLTKDIATKVREILDR